MQYNSFKLLIFIKLKIMKKFAIILLIFGVCIGVHGLVGLFCQNPCFDYLISAFFVAILVGLFYQWKERAVPMPTQCIRTPCPIVYRNSERDFLYCLPYLDLLRTDDVWGVEVAGIKVRILDQMNIRILFRQNLKLFLQIAYNYIDFFYSSLS